MARLPRIQRAVLEVLSERGRTHAYEIKRLLRGVTGHASVYAALAAVAAKGYARAEWSIPDAGSEGGGPPRKYFELTADGARALAEPVASEVHPSGKRTANRATPD